MKIWYISNLTRSIHIYSYLPIFNSFSDMFNNQKRGLISKNTLMKFHYCFTYNVQEALLYGVITFMQYSFQNCYFRIKQQLQQTTNTHNNFQSSLQNFQIHYIVSTCVCTGLCVVLCEIVQSIRCGKVGNRNRTL